MTAPSRPRRDAGLTLVEVMLAIVLGGMITAAIAAALLTSLSVASATTGRIKDSIDAGLISSYLYRDAQSAGGVDPASALLDPSLGVSTTDRGTGCPAVVVPPATVPPTPPTPMMKHEAAALVVRFSWIDRAPATAPSRVVVTYTLDAEQQFTRRVCAPDASPPVDALLVLGRSVTSAVATCTAAEVGDDDAPVVPPLDPCTGGPASVTLAIRGSAAGASFAYQLTASLRGQTPAPLDADHASAIALIALGGPDGSPLCPSIAINGTGQLTVGNALILSASSGSCDLSTIRSSRNAVQALAGTTTSFVATVADPLAPAAAGQPAHGFAVPPATCAAAKQNPSTGPNYVPGVYPRAVPISGPATFAPGVYVFCDGLHVFSGGVVTGDGDGAMLYVAGGGFTVDANARVDLHAATTGSYQNLLIWVAATLPQRQAVTIAGGSLADSFRGLIYAPTSTVHLSSAIGMNIGSLVAGNLVVDDGPGPIRIADVPAQAISPTTIPDAEVGVYAAFGPAALGEVTTPSTWTAAGLPPFLRIDPATGVVSGTPTVAGTFTFDVTTVDATKAAASQRYTLTVDPAPTLSATLGLGEVGVGYTGSDIGAVDGNPPYRWSWSAASGLPEGLGIDPSTGVVSGTPQVAGTFPVTITVTDDMGGTAAVDATLVIVTPVSVTAPASLATGEVTLVYTAAAITGDGGMAPYAWSQSGLPDGLSIDASSGAFSGVPQESGTFDVTITVTDALGGTDSAVVPLVVQPPPVVSALAGLQDGQVTVPYASNDVTATGGTPPYAWAASGLPDGLEMDPSTAEISGTPTTAGESMVTVTVTDAAGAVAQDVLTMTIDPPPEVTSVSGPTTWPAGQVAIAYPTTTVTGTGGIAPYTWSAASLVPGLSIDPSTGVVAGAPSRAGSFTVSVTLTDSLDVTASRSWTVAIKAAPSIAGPAALPAGDAGFAYKATTIGGSGGTTPYAWSATGLPAGLTINASTGVVSGTPTTAGNSTATVVLRDALGATAARDYPVTINPALAVSATTALPAGQVGQAYPATAATSTGGTSPLVWSATLLPAGLLIDPSTGVVSGTPTTAGSYAPVLKVVDAAGAAATRSVPVTIRAAPSVSLPSTLPAGQVGVAYPATTVSGAGGTSPYSWSATTLPDGLVIDPSTGVVSGTPTTAGTVTATVKLTDGLGATATKAYTIVTKAVPIISSPATLPGGQVNVTYVNTTVKATGGTTPYVWTATGLPTGLAIARTTGVVSGTPTTAGSFTPTVTVTDTFAASSSTTFAAVVIKVPPTISGPAAMSPGDVGAAYKSAAMVGAGGTVKYTWTASGLPPGVVLSSTTGAFSGTPTTTGSYTVTVTLKDAVNAVATRTYTTAINPAQAITAPAALPSGQVGQAYSATYTSTGGSSPFVWTATGLPAGVTMGSGTGTLSGTPTTAGTYTVVAKVTDAAASAVTKSLTLVVRAAPSISGPSTLPGGQVNIAYATTTVVGAGGSTPYVWSATGLPAGLTIDPSTGAVSGTPSSAGSFAATVKLTDAVGATVSKTFAAVTIRAVPSVTLAALPAGQVNIAYASTTVTGTGGTTPYSWSASGLPDGLSIAPTTGVVSGTPTVAGAFNAAVTLTDALGAVATKTFPVTIRAVPSISGPAVLPAGDVGFAYQTTTVTGSGGTTAYAWSAAGLPTGLAISSSTGAITGTPTAAGTYSVTVTLKDALLATATRTYPVTISVAQSVTGPATLPSGQVGIAYPATAITSTGGTSPYVWSATSLPAGLVIDPTTGVVSGTPTAAGSSTTTVKVTDAVGASATKVYTVTVRAAPAVTSTATPAAGQVNVAYSATVSGSGGSTPYTWAATALPDGLNIASSTGVVSGTPTTPGTFVSTVVLTDAVGATASKDLTFTIKAVPSINGPASLPAGDVGFAYQSTTITGTGGTVAYTWSATGLPAGLTISSTTGAITGTPTAAGGYTVTVTMKDALLATATRAYPVTINAAQVVTAPATLPGGQAGVAYAPTTVTSTGGTAPRTWSLTGQPAGLTIDPASGVISGTPTASGSFTMVAKVTDSLGASATKTFAAVTIKAPVAVSAPAALPDGQVGIASATTTVTATGGTTPYVWSATNLPAGLAISSSTGAISGTPTTAGAFSVTVTVTDAAGGVASRVFTPTIRAAPSVAGPSALPAGDVGVAYPTATVTAAGGLAPYTWTATGLPAGLTIGSGTGAISGTATTAGTSTAIVTVKDAVNATATRSFSIAINAAPAVAGPSPLPAGHVGTAYWSTTFTSSGGTPPMTWSATGLPGGLAIDAASGVISGTPTVDGTFTVTVSVTDSAGWTGQVTASLTIAAAGTCPATSAGWQGEYFANTSLTGAPAFCRDDPSVNFDWGTGSPAPGVPVDSFSARWTQAATFTAGTYRFVLGSDDGSRLFIDGVKVLDVWQDQVYPSPVPSVVRTLSAGVHTIVVEYYERTGSAQATLSWS